MSSWGILPKKENKNNDVGEIKNKTKVSRELFRMITNKKQGNEGFTD